MTTRLCCSLVLHIVPFTHQHHPNTPAWQKSYTDTAGKRGTDTPPPPPPASKHHFAVHVLKAAFQRLSIHAHDRPQLLAMLKSGMQSDNIANNFTDEECNQLI
eukprot:1161757-Pelagomonas_calceolata.AAC.5